ncbi:ATP-NAD kinase, partial [Halolamina salina]
PVVTPGAGLSVVPVSPFSTRANPWVVPGPLSLTVERDEGAVSLFVDGEERRRVGTDEPVEIAAVGEFTCLRPLVE